ncbi:MAG: hypothetical protein IJS22_05135 [Lachnospiraceae bacterium]|nr:hypothetical protein [Lachnospiraceae bacterium]
MRKDRKNLVQPAWRRSRRLCFACGKLRLLKRYQRVGRFLSEKAKEANYGDGYIDSLADYIQNQFPGIKGFNRRGLYRMRQFYETYVGKEKVSSLLTQLL